HAKIRVSKTIAALRGRQGESFSRSCVWNVIGLGITWNCGRDRSGQRAARRTRTEVVGVLHYCGDPALSDRFQGELCGTIRPERGSGGRAVKKRFIRQKPARGRELA